MRRLCSLCALLLLAAAGAVAQPGPEKFGYDLSYYLPDGNYTYDKSVPTPKDVLGYEVGRRHADYGEIVMYMRALAAASPRVSVRETMRTYEHRPFLEVTITSAENQRNIEKLRAEHLRLTDAAQSAAADVRRMPAVVSFTASVHGNESSGVNSTLVTAYFLAAARGAGIEDVLRDVVVLITPGVNPDGINRFASWVNSSRSLTDVSDLNSREFHEAWPSSRANHYWADCNRDLLMLQHPEGVNGVENYFHWMPNILLDLHEQGGNAGFYFSPGHPKRIHPLVTRRNQDLQREVSTYYAAELDKIHSKYYHDTGYDDYYFGKSACFGDVHGSVAILAEQCAARGHARDVSGDAVRGSAKDVEPGKVRTYPFTIRNMARVSYANIMAGYHMREKLLEYMRDFYARVAAEAKKEAVQGYVLNTRGSRGVAFHLLENLAHQRIDIYRLAKDCTLDGKRYLKDDSYIIPTDQKNMTIIKSMFEDTKEFCEDSVYYDLSAWTFPRAFNLNCAAVKSTARLLGEKVAANEFPAGKVVGGQDGAGYVFTNTEYYAPKMVYELQKRGVAVRAHAAPLTLGSGKAALRLGCGALSVTAEGQPQDAGRIRQLVDSLARLTGVDAYALNEAQARALGGGQELSQPRVAILTGLGTSSIATGEVWYLLDYRFQMRPVLIEKTELTEKTLDKYNVLVMAGGAPKYSDEVKARLKAWVENGGTLVATGAASALLKETGLMELRQRKTAGRVEGAFIACDLDKAHPLAWGLDQGEISVQKLSNTVYEEDASCACPLRYAAGDPVKSGFASHKMHGLLPGGAAALSKTCGKGHVVYFTDNMNYRSYMFGTSKMFANAVFYGSCLK